MWWLYKKTVTDLGREKKPKENKSSPSKDIFDEVDKLVTDIDNKLSGIIENFEPSDTSISIDNLKIQVSDGVIKIDGDTKEIIVNGKKLTLWIWGNYDQKTNSER